MSDTGMNPGEREVRARIDRYMCLRAAERAVAPSMRFRDSAATSRTARELASRMVGYYKLIKTGDGGGVEAVADPSAFEQIDSFLDSYSARLHNIIERTPHSQFRATLPQIAEYHPEEARALLDHCLDDLHDALHRVDLIDYVLTTLSTRTENGMRYVVREPCKASRLMQTVSAAVDEQAGDSIRAAENRLSDAIAELSDLEDVATIVDEIRTLKRSLGRQIFASGVLRRVVEFNTAVANHFESLLDTERAMDDDIAHNVRVPLY